MLKGTAGSIPALARYCHALDVRWSSLQHKVEIGYLKVCAPIIFFFLSRFYAFILTALIRFSTIDPISIHR